MEINWIVALWLLAYALLLWAKVAAGRAALVLLILAGLSATAAAVVAFLPLVT